MKGVINYGEYDFIVLH